MKNNFNKQFLKAILVSLIMTVFLGMATNSLLISIIVAPVFGIPISYILARIIWRKEYYESIGEENKNIR